VKYRLISALLLTVSTTWAADNPMWRSGFTWSCTFSSVIRCGRAIDCSANGEGGNIQVAYRDNQLVDWDGTTHPIKRHYVQTVAGTSEVIGLSPADPAGTFSDNWVGAMLSPKSGVIVQELRPLICKPAKSNATCDSCSQ